MKYLGKITDNKDLVTKEYVDTADSNKVDKVSGKGLSTNDYTTAEKNKLAGIAAGAQVNSVTGVKGNNESSYRTGNVNLTPDNLGAITKNEQGNTQYLKRPKRLNGANDNTLDSKINTLRANRLAFLPADQIIIEKTTDGGATWVDGNIADSTKTGLFSETRDGINIPKLDGVKSILCGVRITFTAMKYNVPSGTPETQKYQYWNKDYAITTERYNQLKEMYFWVSVGYDTLNVKLERSTGAWPNTWSTAFSDESWGMTGWSGNDYISFGQGVFGGGTSQTSNYWNYRLTLMTRGPNGGTDMSPTSPTASQSIYEIRGYGDTWWTKGNEYAANDKLYSHDYLKNAKFPANIQPTSDNVSTLGTSSYRWNNVYSETFTGNLTGTATNASKVNNHTVQTDVPANAVFTDTTYESKAAASGGTAVSLVTTGEKYTWNNKQNALTNPVTGTGTSGYLAKFNGTSTITNGLEYDNNNHLGLYNDDYGIEYSDQGLILSDPNGDYLIEPWALVTDSKSAASGGTDLSLVSTGEKYTWNNKQDVLESGTNIKTINNTSLLGSGNISISGGGSKNIWYATCSTAASTSAKVVATTSSDFELTTGNMLRVLFTYANSASAPTLTVDSKTAKSVRVVRETSGAQYHWQAGETVDFVYDGTYFLMVDRAPATTTYYGPTKLSDSTSSTSTSLAATPSAVKSAYDLANTANNLATNVNTNSYQVMTACVSAIVTGLSSTGKKMTLESAVNCSNHCSISSGGIKCAKAGYVLVSGQVQFYGVNDNNVCNLAIYKNNTSTPVALNASRSANDRTTIVVSPHLIDVAVNDVFYMYVSNTSSSTGQAGATSSSVTDADKAKNYLTVQYVKVTT